MLIWLWYLIFHRSDLVIFHPLVSINSYIRCIWGWLLRVPSQGYHHFPYESWTFLARFQNKKLSASGQELGAEILFARRGLCLAGCVQGGWLHNVNWNCFSVDEYVAFFLDFLFLLYIYTPVLVSLFGSVALPCTNYWSFTVLPYAEAGWALVELPRNYSRRAWADATLRALDTKDGFKLGSGRKTVHFQMGRFLEFMEIQNMRDSILFDSYLQSLPKTYPSHSNRLMLKK